MLVFSRASDAHRYVSSFPTRRSSDLGWNGERALGLATPLTSCPRILAGAHQQFELLLLHPLLEDPEARLLPDVKRLVHALDRKSTRLNSSHLGISYAVFCLKKKHITH